MTVESFRQKLTEGIVGVLGNTVNAIRYLGNTLFRIVFVSNRSAIRQENSADKLGGRGRFQFLRIGMLVCYRALDVIELARNESAAKLKLVEYLASKRIGLTMRSNGIAVYIEFYNGVIVVCLVVRRELI